MTPTKDMACSNRGQCANTISLYSTYVVINNHTGNSLYSVMRFGRNGGLMSVEDYLSQRAAMHFHSCRKLIKEGLADKLVAY
jgi:hypothetical protein